MPLAINISKLSFAWPGKNGFRLNINNWQVSSGSHVFLYGPSGSGKSTLLNLLSGVMPAQSGNLEVLAEELTTLSARQRDRFRARHIGMIFQQFNLLPYLSGEQNIQLAGRFNGKNKLINTDYARYLYGQLALSDNILQQDASTLSVGQQQRIAVARALIYQPELIIADEPTSALDTELRDSFVNLLLSNATHSTVIFVSHDRSLMPLFDQQFDIRSLQNNVEAPDAD
ncbi:MAG: putative ABC transport system ATP-binding protein [Paraglaciecola sp.]|jgi:putative ABC transport system ATP-binding protein